MHSFTWMVLAGAGTGMATAMVLDASTPIVTPGPSIDSILAIKRDGPDAVSLANILLTAIPESLRQIAATNVPAVSSILWEEFLDDKKPSWFLALPTDIQSYLISQFGPKTTIPSVAASAAPSSAPAWVSSVPAETSAASETQPTETESAEMTQASKLTKSAETTRFVTSIITVSSSSIGIPIAKPTESPSSSSFPTSSPAAPSSHDSGLSKQQKIGIGVGIPFAILGAAALGFGLCLLLRRRRKSKNGSVPPSSPGFIPRFAFQEKSTEHLDQIHPLYRNNNNHSNQDLSHMGWDDDVIQPSNVTQAPHTSKPIMAPALFHTHSSNRARGRRTSYQSLHSVPEVEEQDEAESPVLPKHSPQRQRPTHPPIPVASQVKRKPVPSADGISPPHTNRHSLAAQAASRTLLHQAISSPHRQQHNNNSFTLSPAISPVEERNAKNPFSNDYSYIEDYGPEYHNGYIEIENGLYGGNQSLSRYLEPKCSKTEWPLKNGGENRQNKSPL
ncbi:hypothetical protein K469DRAFT_721471 [Zopfia rhizophila CBS 207.26]|uniref:Mid2 domain-containing protein n=1 Tax=Zopfia rhizophila CBS 207.26 TaxID=1314779 RepID=A0A6A6EGC0_9PEZI|nr:hypothetical protein K469DRAFT_721471 [Zopfia rhizophila CBS 207.26]